MSTNYTYFTTEELRCKCPRCVNSIIIPKSTIMTPLSLMRQNFGKPIRVTCGVRCVEHNQEIGGAADSRHVWPNIDAVDIECTNSSDRYDLIKLAMRGYVSMIEVCPNHIHLDMRPGPTMLIMGEDK